MKRIVVVALLTTVAAAASSQQPSGAPQSERTAGRTPVVIELFTSEGCSSCPPADAVLRRLSREQPLPGVEIIALGEHVDYWNDLGWPDPFSSAAFSARQSRYQARVFTSGVVYTPQIVVDGIAEAVGSDSSAVRRAVQRAAARATLGVRLSAVREGARAVVDVAVDAPATGRADVLLVAVEDGLTTAVPRGENSGRTLTHDAVVRWLETAGHVGAGAASIERAVPLDAGWNAAHMRIIALVQDSESLEILGAAQVPLAAP
jgi:hypothetical protein